MLLASSAAGLNDLDETRQLVEEMRAKDQDRSGYHLALGILALAQKDQARAETEFNTALKVDPKSAAAYTNLGNFYWSRNDLQAADRAFKAAADLAPPPPPMQLRYAEFKLRTGAAPEAKKILEDINSKSPDYLPASVALMRVACAERLDDACATRVQTILARDTMNYDGLFQDGLLNIQKGDAAKAVREFEYLSALYTKNPQVRYQLARAYLLLAAKSTSIAERRSAIERAENRLNEAVQLDPNFDPATVLLAELKIGKGSPAAAVDLLTPVIKARPQIAQAHYLLATAYLAQQKRDEALAVYRRMTELFPNDPQPSFSLEIFCLRNASRQRPATPSRKPSRFRRTICRPQKSSWTSTSPSSNTRPPWPGCRSCSTTTRKHRIRKPRYCGPCAARFTSHNGISPTPSRICRKPSSWIPTSAPAYLLQAQLYLASNKQDEAIAKLSALVEKNNDPRALMLLALIQTSLKHFDAARDAYEKVLAIAPNSALALNNLAAIYSDQFGQVDKGLRARQESEGGDLTSLT